MRWKAKLHTLVGRSRDRVNPVVLDAVRAGFTDCDQISCGQLPVAADRVLPLCKEIPIAIPSSVELAQAGGTILPMELTLSHPARLQDPGVLTIAMRVTLVTPLPKGRLSHATLTKIENAHHVSYSIDIRIRACIHPAVLAFLDTGARKQRV